MTQNEVIETTLAFHAGENADTASDRRWSAYCDRVAELLGVPHMDGSDDEEGYSLDHAGDFYSAGMSATEAATEFLAIMGEGS